MDRVRDSTKENYYTIWRLFNQFFIKLDVKPDTWEERMVLFIGYLADQNKKACTIRSYISAIKGVLINGNVEINEDRFILNAITQACKYKRDVATTRLPIHKHLLKTLLDDLSETYATQPYLLKLYRALFITAYFGLFRVGELMLGTHPVKAKDVYIGTNKKQLIFILWSSKTHTPGQKPQIIKIKSNEIQRNYKSQDEQNPGLNSDSLADYCPFEIIDQFLAVRKPFKSHDEQFFVFRDRTPVTAYHFNSILNKTLENCGIDSKLYTATSFRSGRAGDLLEMGVSVEIIKKLGRWKSNAIYNYFK